MNNPIPNLHHVEDSLIKYNLFNVMKSLPEAESIEWNVVGYPPLKMINHSV